MAISKWKWALTKKSVEVAMNKFSHSIPIKCIHIFFYYETRNYMILWPWFKIRDVNIRTSLVNAIKIKHEPFSSSATLKQIKGTFAEKRGVIAFKKHALFLAAAKNTAREIKVSLFKINVFIKRRKKWESFKPPTYSNLAYLSLFIAHLESETRVMKITWKRQIIHLFARKFSHSIWWQQSKKPWTMNIHLNFNGFGYMPALSGKIYTHYITFTQLNAMAPF